MVVVGDGVVGFHGDRVAFMFFLAVCVYVHYVHLHTSTNSRVFLLGTKWNFLDPACMFCVCMCVCDRMHNVDHIYPYNMFDVILCPLNTPDSPP